jgi:hypothetical protein
MKLNRDELEVVERHLRGKGEVPGRELLDKVELGIFVFPPLPFGNLNILGPEQFRQAAEGVPLFLAGRFGAQRSLHLFRMFRERQLPYLLVRTESYEAYLDCNGEIMSTHCEEDQDSIREAIERLRRQCGAKHPSVSPND